MKQVIDKPSRKKPAEKLKEALISNFDQSQQAQGNLLTVKQNALKQFELLGFPSLKNEEYKYTPIARALEKSFTEEEILTSNTTPITLTAAQLKDILPQKIEANVLVFVNGRYTESLSKLISPKEEIVIEEFSKACETHAPLFEKHFAQYASIETDGFTAMNTAFAQQGVFIHVPKGKAVEKPVMLYFISDTTHGKTFTNLRNLFVIGENSQVKISESFYTFGKEISYTNAVTEIMADQQAIFSYYKIESESDLALHTGTTQIYQKRNSISNCTTVTLSGDIIRNNLNISLDDEYCEANMFGLSLLEGNHHVDNHTIADHRKPRSLSNELYKNVLDGSSKGVFNGKIYVRPDAQKTNAFQSNMNILLTDEASIKTKPQLEIWADDVKCSHGATTGQIDNEQLFYLRTRGLSEEDARALLLYAFALEVLENIKIKELREQLDKIVAARLHKNFE